MAHTHAGSPSFHKIDAVPFKWLVKPAVLLFTYQLCYKALKFCRLFHSSHVWERKFASSTSFHLKFYRPTFIALLAFQSYLFSPCVRISTFAGLLIPVVPWRCPFIFPFTFIGISILFFNSFPFVPWLCSSNTSRCSGLFFFFLKTGCSMLFSDCEIIAHVRFFFCNKSKKKEAMSHYRILQGVCIWT